MNTDLKIFQIFVLIVLITGSGYYFGNIGKFIFPVNYSHLVIGFVSFYFFFTTKFSRLSFFLLPFGLSLIYLLFPDKYTPVFQVGNSVTTVLFLIFLFKYAITDKKNDFRLLFLFLVLTEIVEIGIRGMLSYVLLYKIIYSINFILISLILRKNKELKTLNPAIKHFIIVLGMFYFIEIMSFY